MLQFFLIFDVTLKLPQGRRNRAGGRGNQLTLSQSGGGVDYAHRINKLSSPRIFRSSYSPVLRCVLDFNKPASSFVKVVGLS